MIDVGDGGVQAPLIKCGSGGATIRLARECGLTVNVDVD
jgi:hypothetical protein